MSIFSILNFQRAPGRGNFLRRVWKRSVVETFGKEEQGGLLTHWFGYKNSKEIPTEVYQREMGSYRFRNVKMNNAPQSAIAASAGASAVDSTSASASASTSDSAAPAADEEDFPTGGEPEEESIIAKWKSWNPVKWTEFAAALVKNGLEELSLIRAPRDHLADPAADRLFLKESWGTILFRTLVWYPVSLGYDALRWFTSPYNKVLRPVVNSLNELMFRKDETLGIPRAAFFALIIIAVASFVLGSIVTGGTLPILTAVSAAIYSAVPVVAGWFGSTLLAAEIFLGYTFLLAAVAITHRCFSYFTSFFKDLYWGLSGKGGYSKEQYEVGVMTGEGDLMWFAPTVPNGHGLGEGQRSDLALPLDGDLEIADGAEPEGEEGREAQQAKTTEPARALPRELIGDDEENDLFGVPKKAAILRKAVKTDDPEQESETKQDHHQKKEEKQALLSEPTEGAEASEAKEKEKSDDGQLSQPAADAKAGGEEKGKPGDSLLNKPKEGAEADEAKEKGKSDKSEPQLVEESDDIDLGGSSGDLRLESTRGPAKPKPGAEPAGETKHEEKAGAKDSTTPRDPGNPAQAPAPVPVPASSATSAASESKRRTPAVQPDSKTPAASKRPVQQQEPRLIPSEFGDSKKVLTSVNRKDPGSLYNRSNFFSYRNFGRPGIVADRSVSYFENSDGDITRVTRHNLLTPQSDLTASVQPPAPTEHTPLVRHQTPLHSDGAEAAKFRSGPDSRKYGGSSGMGFGMRKS